MYQIYFSFALVIFNKHIDVIFGTHAIHKHMFLYIPFHVSNKDMYVKLPVKLCMPFIYGNMKY